MQGHGLRSRVTADAAFDPSLLEGGVDGHDAPTKAGSRWRWPLRFGLLLLITVTAVVLLVDSDHELSLPRGLGSMLLSGDPCSRALPPFSRAHWQREHAGGDTAAASPLAASSASASRPSSTAGAAAAQAAAAAPEIPVSRCGGDAYTFSMRDVRKHDDAAEPKAAGYATAAAQHMSRGMNLVLSGMPKTGTSSLTFALQPFRQMASEIESAAAACAIMSAGVGGGPRGGAEERGGGGGGGGEGGVGGGGGSGVAPTGAAAAATAAAAGEKEGVGRDAEGAEGSTLIDAYLRRRRVRLANIKGDVSYFLGFLPERLVKVYPATLILHTLRRPLPWIASAFGFMRSKPMCV